MDLTTLLLSFHKGTHLPLWFSYDLCRHCFLDFRNTHLFNSTTAMVSVPFPRWIVQRRTHGSRSSGQLDDEELDDDLTLGFLNETPSGSTIFTPGRNLRRDIAHHRIARIVTDRIANVLLLTSLVMFAILAGLFTYDHITRPAEDGYAVAANGTKALVLASYHDQNVTWLNRVSPE